MNGGQVTIESVVVSLSARPRRWWQFRLRTLLGVMTLVSVVVGWQANLHRRHLRAVESLVDQGVEVMYFEEGESATDLPAVLRWFHGLIGGWMGDQPVRVLLVQSHRVDGFDLGEIGELPELRRLVLEGDGLGIRPSDLRMIAEHPGLESARFFLPELTDAGLYELRHSKTLTVVELDYTQVTDECVARLMAARPELVVSDGAVPGGHISRAAPGGRGWRRYWSRSW